MTTVAQDELLPLPPLTFLVDGEDVVVGCAEHDAYAVLPPDGAALLERLTREPVAAAARWYETTYGEPVDIDDFVATLEELGFVASRTSTLSPAGAETGAVTAPGPASTSTVGWQRLGRAAFSPAAALLAAVLIVAAVAAMVADPQLRPHPNQVFFSDYLVLIELTVAFGQVPLILIHELAHVLAARRIGVPARIRISHRMYFVVFETVMDGLVTVPRRQRYLPMLAGMLTDLLIVCALTLTASATGHGGGQLSLVGGVCLALAFSTLIRSALEFLLFLRTDIYYLICTVTGAIDLHTTSSQILANLWWRLIRRPGRLHEPGRWHPRDVRLARWYAPIHLLGYGLAIGLLLSVLLPISWRFLSTAAGQLLHPNPASGLFWDALALLVLNTAQPAVAGLIWLRERAQQRRRRPRHHG